MVSSSTATAREQGNSRSIDQDVLSCIQHLDVTDNIVDRSQSAVAYGGFCEVFKGRLHRYGRKHLDVAIKRLRFHVDKAKVEKAGPLVLTSVTCISL